MNQDELLIKMKELIAKLEDRQQLIARYLEHEDPELVLLGQYLKPIVDECHTLLTRTVVIAQQD